MKTNKSSCLLLLFLASTSLNLVHADQEMYQLQKFQISDMVLLETKKINQQWLACIETPTKSKKTLLVKIGQGIGKSSGIIRKIDKKGMVINEFRQINAGDWTETYFRWPISKENRGSGNRCIWKTENIQKVVPGDEMFTD